MPDTTPSMDDVAPMMQRAVEALDVLAKAVSERSSTPTHLVNLAEAVSDARAALYAELIRQGWVPPESVPPDLDLDRQLKQQGLGAAYDEP